MARSQSEGAAPRRSAGLAYARPWVHPQHTENKTERVKVRSRVSSWLLETCTSNRLGGPSLVESSSLNPSVNRLEGDVGAALFP